MYENPFITRIDIKMGRCIEYTLKMDRNWKNLFSHHLDSILSLLCNPFFVLAAKIVGQNERNIFSVIVKLYEVAVKHAPKLEE